MILPIISLLVLAVFFFIGFFLGKSTGYHKGRIYQIELQLDREFREKHMKKTKW
jgi:ABC-type dipeptide/oligopeptide/nickel transport system permease subunit